MIGDTDHFSWPFAGVSTLLSARTIYHNPLPRISLITPLSTHKAEITEVPADSSTDKNGSDHSSTEQQSAQGSDTSGTDSQQTLTSRQTLEV